MSEHRPQNPDQERAPAVDLSAAQVGNVSIGEVVGGDKHIHHHYAPAAPEPPRTLAQRNREALIQIVERTWVAGVLRASLHEQLRIELGMVTRPDTVVHPWQSVVRLPGQEARRLPPGTPIGDIFWQAGGRLLILGAPGGGKTTTLLTLADELLAQARADELAPVPVVFVLSTWAQGRPALEAWLVDELRQRYKVDPQLGRAWLKQRRILPLLDGLDEVGRADEVRASCVEAINGYLDRSGGEAVVCSRSSEYARQGRRLALEAAVELQALDAEQADAYLAAAGADLAGLRAAVREDAVLRELSASPLFLSLLAVTHRGAPAGQLAGQDRSDAERRLWQAYVERRLTAVRADAPTAPGQLWARLSWLARGMGAHDQQVFYIEYLQPSWLASRRQQQWFRLLSGLAIFLTAAPVSFLALTSFERVQGIVLLALTAFFGAAFALSTAGGGVRLWETVSWSWRQALAWRSVWREAWRAAGLGVLVGAACGLLMRDSLGAFSAGEAAAVGAGIGLSAGLLLGLPLAILIASLQRNTLRVTTRPNEGVRRSIVTALRMGIGVTAALGTGITALLTLLPIIGIATIFGATRLVRVVARPDQGGASGGAFSDALRNGFELIDSVGGAVALSAVALIVSQPFIVPVGLLLSIGGFLHFGGDAVIKHVVLRVLLRHYSRAPWDFAAFLDEAVSRGLMARAGGGYRFTHRLLQEHLALGGPLGDPAAAILGPHPGGDPGAARAGGEPAA